MRAIVAAHLALNLMFVLACVEEDMIPPAEVTAAMFEPGDTEVTISWTVPVSDDVADIMIRRSTTDAPRSSTEGELVCDPCTSPTLDIGLTNGVTYYYVIIAYDHATTRNFSAGISGQATPNQFWIAGGVQDVYLKASNSDAGIAFGYSVAVDGDTLAIGAFGENSSATGIDGDQADDSAAGSGAVYVFTRIDVGWRQQAYIKASNTDPGDFFGFSVALDGDTLVVGAFREDSSSTSIDGDQTDNMARDAGAVYVFTRTGSTWSQQAYIKASNAEAYDLFGSVVEVDGDTLAVAAPWEDSSSTSIDGDQTDNMARDAGAVYVFTRTGSTWSQQAYIKASNTFTEDSFGSSLSLSGNTLAVSADWERSNASGINGDQADNSARGAGAVYVLTRTGSTWSQQAYIKASNTDAFDLFGSLVEVDGDTLAVSATWEDSSATGIDGDQTDNTVQDAGAVYIFTRADSIWSQQAYIKASNTDPGDLFGSSLALSGNTLAIGVPWEDSNARGKEGDQADNSSEDAGAVYVFTRTGSTWSQRAYIKASNTDPEDSFGLSLSLSGKTLAVGAPWEDSNAKGVGGNEEPNTAVDAGAVYVFESS